MKPHDGDLRHRVVAEQSFKKRIRAERPHIRRDVNVEDELGELIVRGQSESRRKDATECPAHPRCPRRRRRIEIDTVADAQTLNIAQPTQVEHSEGPCNESAFEPATVGLQPSHIAGLVMDTWRV
jgi:hypothetical protein